jgi:hypothetical protein
MSKYCDINLKPSKGNKMKRTKELTVMDKPAFPSGLIDPATPEDAVHSLHKGMTLRQYAAIKLRVPESGEPWLDDMIRKSLATDRK